MKLLLCYTVELEDTLTFFKAPQKHSTYLLKFLKKTAIFAYSNNSPPQVDDFPFLCWNYHCKYYSGSQEIQLKNQMSYWNLKAC